MKPISSFAGALAIAVAGCGHGPELQPEHVEGAWIQPLVDQAAHAASRCLRDPDRIVSIEVALDGTVRTDVLPWPGGGAEERDCVNRAVASLRPEPPMQVVRTLVRADGRLADPWGTRERALVLRARAAEGLDAIEPCRGNREARHPGAVGRVAVEIVVAEDGSIARASRLASTLDGETDRCVVDGARKLRLPPSPPGPKPIPYRYVYSYLLGPRGITVGAPDVEPVDRYDLARALEAIRARTDGCMAMYRMPGDLLVHLVVGNDGVPADARVERSASTVEDRPANDCLAVEMRRLRLPPFDGPPARLTVPFNLR